MIEVRDLTKRFGAVLAVDGVSFRAEDGAVTALLGHNGAGKTTTLRAVYGLIRPDSGSASVDGIDVAVERRGVQERLGVLSEARGLYPRMTAREHLRYFARLHGIDGSRVEDRCARLVDVLEMADIADRRAQGFSHGERTKVVLACALAHDPQNVILDEPTDGLDVMSTRAVRRLIRRLRDEGRCVVFSSHIMQEVAAVSDSIVILSAGRVVAAGTVDMLRESTGKESLEDVFVAITESQAEQA